MKLYKIEKLCNWLDSEADMCFRNMKDAVKKEQFSEALKLKIEADTYVFLSGIIGNENELEEICG